MTKHLCASLTLLFTISTCSLSAVSQTSISLQDSVDAAMEKQKHLFVNSVKNDNIPLTSGKLDSWIDGPAQLSAQYLYSTERLGTDEIGLGLQLPIKSTYKRDVDNRLNQNQRLLQDVNVKQNRLIISGLLRQLVWDLYLEQAKIAKAEKSLALVNSLETTNKVLSESGAVPQYIALLLGKESISSQVLLLQHQHNAQSLMARYQMLTGLSQFPSATPETLDNPDSSILRQHPDVVSLDLTWQNTLAQFNNTNVKAQPWQLQLSAVKLDTMDFTDNQIGVGLSVPLSIGSAYTLSEQSEYLRARSQFESNQQALLTSLKQEFDIATQQLAFLKQKQKLLDKGQTSLAKMMDSITTLLDANVANKETLIRNALDVINAQSEIEINRIEINKQISQIKQVSGLTL